MIAPIIWTNHTTYLIVLQGVWPDARPGSEGAGQERSRDGGRDEGGHRGGGGQVMGQMDSTVLASISNYTLLN